MLALTELDAMTHRNNKLFIFRGVWRNPGTTFCAGKFRQNHAFHARFIDDRMQSASHLSTVLSLCYSLLPRTTVFCLSHKQCFLMLYGRAKSAPLLRYQSNACLDFLRWPIWRFY